MPPKANITSKQVAELAGVSKTTVSFVLNNVEGTNISEETRQRVIDAAKKLGYVPNASARSLARGLSTNIGLILGRPHPQVFIDEYVPNLISGVSRVTQINAYRIILELVEDAQSPNAYINLLRAGEVAGIIVNFTSWTPAEVQQIVTYANNGYPIVSLDHIHPTVASVAIDKLEGTRRIIQHLLNLGHRRIACITYAPLASHSHIAARLDIYREQLSAHGIAYDESLVGYGLYDPETGYHAMKAILARPNLPTAVYAMNDMMAFGAISAIRETGLNIPEDIAIVGFDDVRLASFSEPSLTTMRSSDVEYGRFATEMLFQLIEGRKLPNLHVDLQMELVIRNSCGYKLSSKHSMTDA